MRFWERLRGFARDFREVVRYYEDVKSIARRMFVTNSFDGILAAIGVNVGGFSPDADPARVAMGIIGGGVAMGVFSGVIGVYLSERAERLREIAELERKVARPLKGTVYWKAARVLPIYTALWSGLGIVLFPTLIAVPYFLSVTGIIEPMEAFYASLAIALVLMGSLGYYLAVISGEDKLKSTLRAVSIGVGGALLVFVLRNIVGVPLA